MSTIPTIELNDGTRIPQLGFGVFQIDPDETAQSVQTALDIGYRHIDTAEMYQNEAGVGQGIRDAGLDRAEVYITSKLNNGFHKPDDARRAFDATLEELGSDYVDLFLIHWPLPTLYDGDFVSTWQTLEEFKKDGRARSIGVSNFQVDHLERLARETDDHASGEPDRGAPVLHQRRRCAPTAPSTGSPPRRGRRSPRARCSATPSSSELPRPRPDAGSGRAALAHPARRYRVPEIDDSATRIRENFEVFDFELDDADMNAITALDKGEAGRTGPNPDKFDYIPD